MDEKSKALIEKLGLKAFRPMPFIQTGKLQTIVGTYWPQKGEPRDTTFHDFRLSDGDILVLAENSPESWSDGDRIVTLVHGLTGCFQSNYMIRMARAFAERGAKVFRINLRCCGPGMGKARNPYHCGISEDTREVLRWLKEKYPRSPVTQVGFSLGGNVTLKMAGEDGAHPSGNLDSVMAVSPPVDVKESSRLLCSPENAFFDRYFTRRVLNDVQRLHRHFPDLPKVEFPKKMNLIMFDDIYTARMCGFKNGEDYYEKASSFPLLSKIQIPTLILGAEDDPVISGACFSKVPRTGWIEKIISAHGGHVGFLGFGGSLSWRWADEVLIRWAELNLSGLRHSVGIELEIEKQSRP